MIAVAYLAALGLLAVYGLHRASLVFLYLRHRRERGPAVARFGVPPVVTVQLPLYNERYVAERLLDAVARLRWPADHLEIQVLDDSTDDTSAICARKVAELRAAGMDVKHGLHTARGELLLVFDADFVPGPDLLERAVDRFTDAGVAMVQLRWEHLNRGYSLLTETQALLLDAHFVVEHGARFRAGRFFNFAGTAGLWRKAAIIDAGGWQHDTLTEDMDLSYRAQLRGWRFVFLDDPAVPAELPVEMNAFKSQQFRWAKGQMQVARKLLPAVLAAPLPLRVKIDAFFHLTNNVTYALLLLVCLLALPNLWAGPLPVVADGTVFGGASLAVAAFLVLSQRGRPLRALGGLPCAMALCAGIAVTQARAVVEALVGHDSEFVRTPKHGVTTSGERVGGRAEAYRGVRTATAAVELFLFAYCLVTAGLALALGRLSTVPFLVTFAVGFGYVGVKSLWPPR
jgi:hypothetical protein